jgi:hypothetical protein
MQTVTRIFPSFSHITDNVCTWPEAEPDLHVCCALPAAHECPYREIWVCAHNEVPWLCLLHSNAWMCPQCSGCPSADTAGSWYCLWRYWICFSQNLGSMCYHYQYWFSQPTPCPSLELGACCACSNYCSWILRLHRRVSGTPQSRWHQASSRLYQLDLTLDTCKHRESLLANFNTYPLFLSLVSTHTLSSMSSINHLLK